MSGKRYEISTLADIVETYLAVSETQREVLIREVGEAVRLIAPMVSMARLVGADFDYAPITWVDDDAGTARVRVATEDGAELADVQLTLRPARPAQ